MTPRFSRLRGRSAGAHSCRTGGLVALLCLALLATAPLPAAEADTSEAERERVTAGGRLAWVVVGDLDLVGDLWVDLPFRVDDRNSVYLSVDSRTTLDQPDGLTFRVQDLQYDLGLGWRGRPAWLRGPRLSASLGQRGKQAVDADGQAYVRYLGVGLESASYRAYRASPRCAGTGCTVGQRFDWRFAVGPVIQEREVSADAILQGETSFWLASIARPRMAFGLDLALDSLVDGIQLDADVAVGPRISFPVAGGRRASFYLRYRSGGNPLGAEQPLWLLGFAYDEGRTAPPDGPAAPGIDGRVSLGGGDGRTAGQLRLRFLSPAFAAGIRGTVVIDANILTAEETGDLYYFWTAGLEREHGPGVYGGYLYHRSNHQLAEPNDRVTSLNVLEAGYETSAWQRPARETTLRRLGAIDGRARVGWLIESSFGENRRWHFRGGARWTLPVRGRAPLPYLLVEAEAGDVERRVYAAGMAILRKLELQLEYRSDEQYFARDETALLLAARYWL